MDQAVDEMGKALVVNPEHYLLRKNMAALLARKGDYSGAVGHAERAAQVRASSYVYCCTTVAPIHILRFFLHSWPAVYLTQPAGILSIRTTGQSRRRHGRCNRLRQQ